MQKTPIKLLIVDDEAAMRRVLQNALRPSGFAIEEAAGGEAALEAMRLRPSEIVLLDINMPGVGGIETCRRIRQMAAGAGILMITVRDSEDDKVRALEAGADDYVTKPFRFRELLARLGAVHRRLQVNREPASEIIRAGDLEIDLTRRMFWKKGVEVHLSQKEFDILAYLMSRPDTPVPNARLLQAIWGPEYGGEAEYLRTYVRLLRRKIERDAAHPEHIITEPWVGYRFCSPATPEALSEV
jgi:two-component system KDP operon response regulator KdpE